MSRIRERVQALHTGPAGVQRGFRVENSAQNASKVYLYDAIGGWDGVLAKDVIAAITGLGDFDLHVNSPGGDIFEGVAIHNAIKNHPGTVTAYIDGVAASAASFIVMAADEVVIEANASMMIHDGWALTIGNAADHRESAALLDMLSDTIAGMYYNKTGRDRKEWREQMAEDTWYSAAEAVEAKLADRIMGDKPTEDDDDTASAGLDLTLFNVLANFGAPTSNFALDRAALQRTDREQTVARVQQSPTTEAVEGFATLLKGAIA